MKEYVKQKLAPHPNVYNIFRRIHAIYRESGFFVHAICSGKLFIRYSTKRFSAFCSRQKIMQYSLPAHNLATVPDFRSWLQKNELRFLEGGWTFYLPPQDNLYKYFHFLVDNYPPDAGLKILKDFRSPNKARYTNHKQNPSAGAFLKRYMTQSSVSLLRTANYLYLHGLGIRVYDLVSLKESEQTLTCFIVQHVQGPDVDIEHYNMFMTKLETVLKQGEITTIHESVDMMSDFIPPSCNNNLIMSSKDGKPLYVDFQGFLLNERMLMKNITGEAKDVVHFGAVRFFRGGNKYLYQSLPGFAVGKRDTEKRWRYFNEMFKEGQCPLCGRVVYDIGCNMGLMLYNALGEGAKWGIGWDFPNVVISAKKVLLALGATRFDLVGEEISNKANFVTNIPARYRITKDGVLFYLAASEHIGFPEGIKELPWEYMLYEGHAGQSIEMSIESLRNVSWLKKAQIVSQRSFADGDTPKRAVILLRRQV